MDDRPQVLPVLLKLQENTIEAHYKIGHPKKNTSYQVEEGHTVCDVRNPRDPKLKETTGGTAPLNKFEACRMTPSPPKHTTKSTLS